MTIMIAYRQPGWPAAGEREWPRATGAERPAVLFVPPHALHGCCKKKTTMTTMMMHVEYISFFPLLCFPFPFASVPGGVGASHKHLALQTGVHKLRALFHSRVSRQARKCRACNFLALGGGHVNSVERLQHDRKKKEKKRKKEKKKKKKEKEKRKKNDKKSRTYQSCLAKKK